MTAYDDVFYSQQEEGSLSSARIIVPLIMELIKPKSVVDVGCGVGTWLSVYEEGGVEQVLGIDGEYVPKEKLYIDPSKFVARNLSDELVLNRKFDLVQSLEVAEHIDKRAAETFINNLVMLGEVVLFSAAIPYQLGTDHVNEQFLDYWVNLFKRHDYLPVDCIRSKVWGIKEVDPWYKQNTILFVSRHYLGSHPLLRDVAADQGEAALSMVHPELWSRRINMLLGILRDMANFLHKKGDAKGAEKLYDLLLNFNPEDDGLWNYMGQIAAQQGDSEMAICRFSKAIELNPDSAAHYYFRGRLFATNGDGRKSRADILRALEINPELTQAKELLASLDP